MAEIVKKPPLSAASSSPPASAASAGTAHSAACRPGRRPRAPHGREHPGAERRRRRPPGAGCAAPELAGPKNTAQLGRLEGAAHVGELLGQLRRGGPRHGRARGGVAGEEQRPHEVLRRGRAQRPVVEALVGEAEVLGRRRAAGEHLGHARARAAPGPPARRRRLGERAGRGRRRRSRARPCAAPRCGVPASDGDDRVPPRAATRSRCAATCSADAPPSAQERRGPLVLQLALARRDVAVDGAGDERMDEAERRLGRRISARASCPVAARGRAQVDARRGRDGREVGAVAEHRDRPRDGDRVRGSRASRTRTAREAARGPSSRPSRRGWRRAARPRSRAPCSSSFSSSGLPPVAAWQASANAGSASSPRRAAHELARRPSALSGRGRSGTVERVAESSASSAGVGAGLGRAQARDRPAPAGPRGGATR